MSAAVVLLPGRMSLSDWRLVYRGSPVILDPIARADVEAGAAALQAIVAGQDEAAQTEARHDNAPETSGEDGQPLQSGVVRLIVALKLASLAQGFSGVRWTAVERLAEFLSPHPQPAIMASAEGDRAVMTAIAGLLFHGNGGSAAAPFELADAERASMISGTQVSAALALAGLFEAERVFQSALVSSALSIAALGGSGLHHPRVHKLHRHPGEIEVAAALRALLAREADASAPPAADGSRCGRMLGRMGACLDLLRQAGTTLQLAANAVTEDRLVFWQAQQVVAGLEDTSSIALAADLIALALREIGALAQPRIDSLASHSGAGGNGEPPAPAAWQPMVAAFIGENAERACLNPEKADPPGEAAFATAAGARRLLPMAGTTALLIAIELLAAARTDDAAPGPAGARGEGGGLATTPVGGALDAVRDLLRQSVPRSNGEAGMPAGDLPAAAELIRSGALAAAAGMNLPSVVVDRSCQGMS